MEATQKILVVDDEPDVVDYISALFEDQGYLTVSAENGIEAIKIAVSELPDLITLDITMPEQSGIKTYQILKNDPKVRHIPVIILTAVGDHIKSVLNQFEEFPEPDGYVNKPVDREELITMTSGLLSVEQ